MHLRGRRRSGIETNPSIAWKIRFHPGVRIAGPNQVLRSKVVELPSAETVHHPRGNPDRAQHDGHRGSEVLAVSLLAFEKKVGYGVAWNAARKLQGVAKMRAQISVYSGRLVIIVVSGPCDLFGQSYDAAIHVRQLQIVQLNFG